MDRDGGADMFEISIPGREPLKLDNLVLDFNGTLAVDGKVIDGVPSRLEALAQHLQLHVLTADTFSTVKSSIIADTCAVHVLPVDGQDTAKLEYVQRLGQDRTVCIGNGRNDRLMLKAAALGIAVVLAEGAASETVMSADVVCTTVTAALDLLLHPLRLVATLRV